MNSSAYRDKESVERIVEAIHNKATKSYRIMEVCGGQTHTILKNGLEELLPKNIELIHGPGCPVCVSDEQKISNAVNLALNNKRLILCTFGDMVRVPSAAGSLAEAKSKGADIRIVYSPLDAVEIARNNPYNEVVFFAVGFETTAPIYALSIVKCKKAGIRNFSFITCMYRVCSVVNHLLSEPGLIINGLLAAGHVCTVTGYKEYFEIAKRFKIGISTTGFEPVDILLGIYDCLEMINNERWSVINSYKRAVNEAGNELAINMLDEYFEIGDQTWRGIGIVENSGYNLRDKYKEYNALSKFKITQTEIPTTKHKCPLNEIYKGNIKPNQCAHFDIQCNPISPLGAAMVSSEGVCSAYYRYSRKNINNVKIEPNLINLKNSDNVLPDIPN